MSNALWKKCYLTRMKRIWFCKVAGGNVTQPLTVRRLSTVQNVSRRKLLYKKNLSMSKRFYVGTNYISPFELDDVYDIHEGTDAGPIIIPNNEAEYLIVGGGAMGLSMAFNLWRQLERSTVLKASKYLAPTILVVEKDPTMSTASTPLSVGSIRQQFSHPSNVQLSLLSADYLRNIKYHLGLAGHDVPDIQFQPQGYLFLASGKGEEQLMKNYETQTKNGAKVMLMTPNKLKEIFPWINTDGIKLASYGLENEGWFDPWSLLGALRTKIKSFGTRSLHGEVVGFKKKVIDPAEMHVGESYLYMPDGSLVENEDQIVGAYIKVPDIDRPVYVSAKSIINCAGAWSKSVSEMAGIGVEDPTSSHPICMTPLPVEPRKRYVYSVHCPDGPVFDCPLMVDPSGVYVRREGFQGMYLCGMSPPDDDAVDHSNLDVDYDLFHEIVWPTLARRVPAFEKLKLKSAWAGYYDFNTFDQNAIIGSHPYYTNFVFLTGFSGHGIQMAMGASACLAEKLVEGTNNLNTKVDIEPFSFDRIVRDIPVREINIV